MMAYVVWFLTPLTCLHCGAHTVEDETNLHTSDLRWDPESINVRPGELLDTGLQEFSDAYLKLRHPVGTEDVHALEQWSCGVCHRAQWARIVLRYVDPKHYRFVSAETVALTPEVISAAHYISSHLDWWVETHPGEESERVLPLLKHLLT
ncbi:hypothetical protein HUA75_33335 [Myxococcus sp. CA040A]|nr:hypothetical protein [Myxococcus sp. CA040A]